MSFHQRLIAATAGERERFLAIPILQHAVRHGVSRALYLDFLAEAYHHVRHTCPLLGLALAHSDDARYRRALLDYLAEERGHDEWILQDIAALGGDARAVRAGRPGRACELMIGYAHYAIVWHGPWALLGMVHVLEGMSVVLATQAAGAIAARLGGGDAAGFSYLRSHGSLDVEHTAFFRELVDGIEQPAAQALIIDTARLMYGLYGDIFREIAVRHGDLRDAA